MQLDTKMGLKSLLLLFCFSLLGRGASQRCQVNEDILPEIIIIENNNIFTRIITLKEEPDPFCILKVISPSGQTIKFNVTGMSLQWPDDNIIHGDKPKTEEIAMHILIHKNNVKALTLIANGTLRFGVYLIFQFRMYVLKIGEEKETYSQPTCKRSDDIISGKVETLGSFQHCMDYNKYKNKKFTEYLKFQKNFINITSYDENYENYLRYSTTSDTQDYTVLECYVTIDPNKYSIWYQTEYQQERLRVPWVLKFKSTCPSQHFGLIVGMLFLGVFLIVSIIFMATHNTKRYKLQLDLVCIRN